MATPSADTRTVAITGASGMIGSALTVQLRSEGFSICPLPHSRPLDPATLEGLDAIVHLAGAPIAQRWTSSTKREIRDSRINGTSALARAVASLTHKPRVVISGSAIGYYGNRGDEQLDERSAPGQDFLAQVCREWEAATQPMTDAGVRVAHIRTGIVLSRHGGALAKLLTPFQLGAGGPIGSGTQWMSWISLHDQVRAMRHIMNTDAITGAVNLTAPEAVRNVDFAHALGRALHRPSIVPVPAFALELLFGEMARATILAGQRVAPGVLLQSGFAFDDPTLERALVRELEFVN